jgi:hypothetical protein
MNNKIKIVLSFLGTTDYQETNYKVDDQQHMTKFFAEALSKALSESYPAYKMVVVLTDEAREKHATALRAVCNFDEVHVPSGRNENEFWEMFAKIAEAIPEQSELIVNVTHGFRNQPMLALAACIYLRVVKQVTIERIVYGAFEAKDAEGVAPVFDLTPFLDLIDWSVAAHQFSRYGNAAPLRDLLKSIHGQTHRNKLKYRSQALATFGENLANLGTAFSMVRPTEVLQAANQVKSTVDNAQGELANISQAKPLTFLLDKVNERIQPLTKADNLFSPEGFKAQAAIIRFYLDTEQYAQAITLAREVIVSKLCVDSKQDAIEEREEVEKELDNTSNNLRQQHKLGEEERQLAELWNAIRDLRNDINHAGMRPNPTPAKTALDNIKKQCETVIGMLRT